MKVSSIAALLLSTAALAEAPKAPETPKRRIAVAQVVAAGALPGNALPLLADVIATETQKTKAFEVFSPADIATLLGMERQKQLLGCSVEVSCIAELAGALNVDFMLAGQAADLGERVRVSLTLLDARRGKALARQSVEVDKRIDAMAAGAKALTHAVLKELGVTVVDGELVVKVPDDPASTRRKLSLGVGAVGVAALGVAIAMDSLAVQAFARQKQAAEAMDPEGYDAAKAQVKGYATPAKLLYLSGGALVAAGAAGYFILGRSPGATVLLVPTEGGGYAQLGGTFP